MDVINKYLLSSVADFTFKNSKNKEYILGLKEPQFIENQTLNDTIDEINEIDAEKKIILKKAISTQNYFLIQGPPGTGKTSYILKHLAQLLCCNSNETILLLAYTNRAVDEICSVIKQSKITNFIRLGNKDSSEHTDVLMSHFSSDDLADKVNNCKCFVATVATAIITTTRIVIIISFIVRFVIVPPKYKTVVGAKKT